MNNLGFEEVADPASSCTALAALLNALTLTVKGRGDRCLDREPDERDTRATPLPAKLITTIGYVSVHLTYDSGKFYGSENYRRDALLF